MKKILIIGATSAIAKEVAKIYAQKKAELVLWGRDTQMLDIIAQDLKVHGASQVTNISHDLNDLDAHEKTIAHIWTQLQKIDVVLIAQGILGNQLKAEEDLDELLQIITSNYISHVSLLTFLAQKMRAQKNGTLAVISSVAGDRGKQSNYVYGSAKAGKTVFVDGLRNRLFPDGVHVINFKLGFVDTPMTKDFKKGPLWAKPNLVAQGIVKGIESKKDTVYLPFFWRFIMLIIKSIPESIFKKLKM